MTERQNAMLRTDDGTPWTDGSAIDLISELMAGEETRRRLSAIGEGCKTRYETTASVDEARSLLDAVRERQQESDNFGA